MRLNGYPVLHRAPARVETAGVEVVLVFRERHRPHPFVVALWAPQLGTSWSWGDYHDTLPEAMLAFEKIAKPATEEQGSR